MSKTAAVAAAAVLLALAAAQAKLPADAPPLPPPDPGASSRGPHLRRSPGDPHLLPWAAPAIDQVTRLPDAQDDLDALPRPAGAAEAALGADEFDASALIFANGFESGGTSAWSVAVP
jgi:hypothetical protein